MVLPVVDSVGNGAGKKRTFYKFSNENNLFFIILANSLKKVVC